MGWDDEYGEVPKGCEDYECEWVGHPSYESRDFEDNSEEWYESRGDPLPKACHICRAWRKEQYAIGIITAKCRFCGYLKKIKPMTRIIRHQHEGNWDEYWKEQKHLQLCRLCEEIPSRRRELAGREWERKRKDKKHGLSSPRELRANVITLLHELSQKTENHPEKYAVPTDAEYYSSIKTHADDLDRFGPNELTHLMQERHRFAEKFGRISPEEVLSTVSRVANSTQPDIVQFTQGDDTVIKYDVRKQVCVVLWNDRSSPSGKRIRTAYVTEPAKVMHRIERGDWR